MTAPIGENTISLLAAHAKTEFTSPSIEQAGAKETSAVPFADTFANAIKSANEMSNRADVAQQAFAAGKSDDIHGTMIAVKEADIELRLVATVRNKLVDAFNDLWRVTL